MNSLKILVNSFDNLYPNSHKYEIPLVELNSTHEYNEEDHSIDLTINNEQNNDDNETNEKEDIKEETPIAEEIPSKLSNKSTWLNILSSIILFIPNYFIVKPLLFFWLLITFPFTYFFNDTSSSDLLNETPQQHDEIINEKTELLKHENIISNTIKSPTASSKYIIPPPQRLFPLSRNPGKKRKRKTLILDLDETLIHSLSRGSPRSFNNGSSHMIEVKLNNISTLYYVHKRPYCDFFLKEIAKWFELQIFTASVQEYADPIIDWLESEIINYVHPLEGSRNDRKNKKIDKYNQLDQRYLNPYDSKKDAYQKVFTKRYYRNDCTYRKGVGYIKDLSRFFTRDDDLKNVVILDNSPISYALHEDNAVMIEGWINDQSDRDLLNLLPMLHSLSLCIDVRFILGLRSGEKAFEN